jgi:hypothetical protein
MPRGDVVDDGKMAQTKEAQILCMKRFLETDGTNPETVSILLDCKE